jgi:hypothetical protein
LALSYLYGNKPEQEFWIHLVNSPDLHESLSHLDSPKSGIVEPEVYFRAVYSFMINYLRENDPRLAGMLIDAQKLALEMKETADMEVARNSGRLFELELLPAQFELKTKSALSWINIVGSGIVALLPTWLYLFGAGHPHTFFLQSVAFFIWVGSLWWHEVGHAREIGIKGFDLFRPFSWLQPVGSGFWKGIGVPDANGKSGIDASFRLLKHSPIFLLLSPLDVKIGLLLTVVSMAINWILINSPYDRYTSGPISAAEYNIRRAGKDLGLDSQHIENLIAPKNELSFPLWILRDSGAIRSYRGYRTQHNNDAGENKGGTRNKADVNSRLFRELSLEMTSKNI